MVILIKKILQIPKNETLVKFIFDSIKNLGIIAMVFGAGRWTLLGVYPMGYKYYFGCFIGYSLYFLGAVLLMVNTECIYLKLEKIKGSLFALLCVVLMILMYFPLMYQILNFILTEKK